MALSNVQGRGKRPLLERAKEVHASTCKWLTLIDHTGLPGGKSITRKRIFEKELLHTADHLASFVKIDSSFPAVSNAHKQLAYLVPGRLMLLPALRLMKLCNARKNSGTDARSILPALSRSWNLVFLPTLHELLAGLQTPSPHRFIRALQLAAEWEYCSFSSKLLNPMYTDTDKYAPVKLFDHLFPSQDLSVQDLCRAFGTAWRVNLTQWSMPTSSIRVIIAQLEESKYKELLIGELIANRIVSSQHGRNHETLEGSAKCLHHFF
jgi:hypothetical protein